MEGMKTGGRQLGTPNKVNSELHRLIEERGHNPFLAIIEIAADKSVDANIRLKANVSLLPYLYSQVKSIEPLPPPREKVRIVVEGREPDLSQLAWPTPSEEVAKAEERLIEAKKRLAESENSMN
ncbi:MAG: hypothetical protein HQL00_17010 [Nitrospirae bacterium]|nr:hypothetical protein [Nitrospirota bacterium]